jgi:radical SAM superfamily enzyme YgiQ (UPF0313 family)
MKIKLIHVPRVHIGYEHKQFLLPPLGTAILKTVLDNEGYQTDQDDLNIKVDYDTKYAKNPLRKSINLMLFEDRERIKKFLETKNDPELEEEAEKILKKTKYKGYDIIGLSLLDELIFSVIGTSIVLSKIIKEQTGSTIVLGGLTYPRPKVEFEQFFNTGYVDYIIEGRGDSAFLNLCYGLEKGCVNDLDIDYVLPYNPQKKIKSRLIKPPYLSKKITDFYRPDFDGLPLDLYKYTPTGETKKLSSKKESVLILPYIFVRGCLNNCAFCPIPIGTYGAQKPETVAEDLGYLSKKYKTQYFFFINSNVNPTYDYAKRLAKEFEREDLNIMWNDSANFRQLDTTLIKKLKEVGAVKLIYGLECPSDKILKYIKKGITTSRAEKFLKISHEAGIWNEIDLIAGLPYETDDDIKACVNFLEHNKKYLDYMHLGKFVLKDSWMYKNPNQYGLMNISENVNTAYDLQLFARRFDESHGLKWEQKQKQILHSFDVVHKKIQDLSKERRSRYAPIHMPLLFYLYEALGSKKEVKEHFNQCYTDYANDIPGKSITLLKDWIGKFT